MEHESQQCTPVAEALHLTACDGLAIDGDPCAYAAGGRLESLTPYLSPPIQQTLGSFTTAPESVPRHMLPRRDTQVYVHFIATDRNVCTPVVGVTVLVAFLGEVR